MAASGVEEAFAALRDNVLSRDQAEHFVENAIGSLHLPLGIAPNFLIDGQTVHLPMAVEESSVIAAASHGAKIARLAGGFETEATDPVLIAQVELRRIPGDVDPAEVLSKHQDHWLAQANEILASMVARGGGLRRIEFRQLAPTHGVVHLHVDTRDAMGANLVNTLAEALGPSIAEAFGAKLGLQILSNWATGRVVTARVRVPLQSLGVELAESMVAANEFALLDPYRAATHNKGIMNGIDPLVLATGNDWRAVEAGVHAHAARDGRYRGLTTWIIEGAMLVGTLEIPLAVGTVGGVTRLHPQVRACLEWLGNPSGVQLARYMAALGLAQNLSALKALAGEGIQKGHMKLHARNLLLAEGATDEQVDRLAGTLVSTGTVTASQARKLLEEDS